MNERRSPGRRPLEVLAASTRLGLTSFGGPVAHVGYLRDEYVRRRGWLDDRQYADLVALCQFLPGPASSQIGIAIGTLRAGPVGGVLAWIGFTLPSALALIAFALLVGSADLAGAGWVRGLKLVAVAVVLGAVLAMARTLTPDTVRRLIAIAAAAVLLVWATSLAQVAVLAGGAALGLLLVRLPDRPADPPGERLPIGPAAGVLALTAFVVLLLGLPVLAAATGDRTVTMADTFYSSGALIFGGGHVVLPLLAERVVDPGLVDADRFLAGYGVAQAVPGPLLTFAAYLGAVMREPPNGLVGGLFALVAIFLPSYLLVFGVLPFWSRLRRARGAGAALAGTNAAVVGLLAAALYDPIATTAIHTLGDVAFAVVAFSLIVVARTPPWLVVLAGAAAGQGLQALGVG